MEQQRQQRRLPSRSLIRGPFVWLQVQETASARNFFVSSDGINFVLVYTESNTAFMTTANYGFGLKASGTGITGKVMSTLYSFTETNP